MCEGLRVLTNSGEMFRKGSTTIKSSDIYSSVHHCRRSIDIVANLDFRHQVSVFSRKNVEVATLVAEHDTAVNYRRRSPDRCAHQMLPNQFALICRQTVHIAVIATDKDTAIRNNRTRPESSFFFRFEIQAGFSFVTP